MSAGEHDTNHDDGATGDMLDTEAGAGAGDADGDEALDDEFKAFLTYIEAKARQLATELRDEKSRASEPAAGASEPEGDASEPGTTAYDLAHGIPHYEIE